MLINPIKFRYAQGKLDSKLAGVREEEEWSWETFSKDSKKIGRKDAWVKIAAACYKGEKTSNPCGSWPLDCWLLYISKAGQASPTYQKRHHPKNRVEKERSKEV